MEVGRNTTMTFWHPLVNPKQKGATTDSNFRDIERIRKLPDGPEKRDAINAMIASNVPLVFLKVETYIGLNPTVEFLKDDLVGTGLLSLTRAVVDLTKLKTPEDKGNPTGYIGNRIIWGIARFIDNDKKQQVPADYYPPHPREVNPMDIVDTRDLLDASCQTPEDHVIMEMRERGCTDQEIADRLDISRPAVRVQRHELMERYDTLLKDSSI